MGKSGGGAVVTGVNKAVQTVSVFLASAIAYGAVHAEQRMTGEKTMGVIFVVLVVVPHGSSDLLVWGHTLV